MNLFLLNHGRLRSGWRFAISVVLVIVANYLAGGLSLLLAGGHSRVVEVIFRPVLLALLLIFFLFITRLLDQPSGSLWAYNGLPRHGRFRETLLGALLGFVMITVAVITMAVLFDISVAINVSRRTVITGLVVFGVLLAAALAEELMFRGYPFQRLVEGLGAIGAILVLSALFGVVHMRNPHVSDNRAVQVFAFSNTLLIGIVLALGYLRTRALWFPWGLHFGWNASLGLIYGLPVSGIHQFAVIVRSKASGPEWFLGGGYGIEGGMLGTLVILLGLAYILRFVRPSVSPNSSEQLSGQLPDGIQSGSGV